MILKCKQCGKDFNTTITRSTKYCNNKCYGAAKMGSNNENWKGGRYYSQWGHVYIRAPKKHPHKSSNGYIFEHRLAMEKHIGRYLESTEFVHHLNGIKDDNRIDNLVVITKHEHNTIHFKGRPNVSAMKPRKPGTFKRNPITGRYV